MRMGHPQEGGGAQHIGLVSRLRRHAPDNEKWERVSSRTEAATNKGAKSAGLDVKRPDEQQLDRGKPKHETANSTGSNDSRPVFPRGSVAAMATCSVEVQTEDSANGSLSLTDWLHPSTVTSTATQNAGWRSPAPMAFHPGAVLVGAAKRCSTSSNLPSTSPTAMLEQMQERLHGIAQDMYILNRNCGEALQTGLQRH